MRDPSTSGPQCANYSVSERFAGEATTLQEEADCWAIELTLAPHDPVLQAEFLQWSEQSEQHRQAFQQALYHWQQSEQDLQGLHTQQRVKQVQRRWFLGAGLSAACSMAVWGLSPLGNELSSVWQQWGADYRTQTGERKVLQLAPALTVQLNTQSALSVAHQADRVALTLHSGEVAIQTHNQWCDLTLAQGHIQFFNSDLEVRQVAKQQWVVHCRQGWAQVQWQGTQYALQAGQRADFRAGHTVQLSHGEAHNSSWRDGILVFHEQPLQAVIDEVNRYRPGRVVLLNQDYAQRRFSANLLIEDVNQFIEQLRAQPDWQVREVGDYVLVS